MVLKTSSSAQGFIQAPRSVDLVTGRLVVRRSNWRGQIGSPKNGRSREIPLSEATVRLLKARRHLQGELVFCDERGASLAYEAGRDPLRRAADERGCERLAGIPCATHLR